jgi:hypothetical protein
MLNFLNLVVFWILNKSSFTEVKYILPVRDFLPALLFLTRHTYAREAGTAPVPPHNYRQFTRADKIHENCDWTVASSGPHIKENGSSVRYSLFGEQTPCTNQCHVILLSRCTTSCYISHGVRLSPLGTAATFWPIVPALDDRWWWGW